MKVFTKVLFILLSLGIAGQATATSKLHDDANLILEQKIIKLHNAINSVSLRIRLDDDLHGFIESKNCSFCRTIRITITPNTKAYKNNISVPLKQAKNRSGRFATISYNVKTNNVSTIRW